MKNTLSDEKFREAIKTLKRASPPQDFSILIDEKSALGKYMKKKTKNKYAQELNRLRNKSLSKKRRKEIAIKAVTARWDKARLDKNVIPKQNNNILA